MHRRGHGRRRPLRGLSASGFSRRHRRDACSAAWRCGPFSAAVCSGGAWWSGAGRGWSALARAAGGRPPARRPSWHRRDIASRAVRALEPRAPRPALIPKQYKARRRKAERSLKPPPTLPTRLALGLALLGLLPSPEVVVPVVLVRRRRARSDASSRSLKPFPRPSRARGSRAAASGSGCRPVCGDHDASTKAQRTLRQPQLSFWQWPQRQLSSFGGSPLCLPRSNLRPPSLLRLRLLLR